MKQCVFQVQTRVSGETYMFDSMWSGYHVIALDAVSAIQAAKKKMGKNEYAMSVQLIAEID